MVLCALSVTACSIPLPVTTTPPLPEPERGAVERTARAEAAPAVPVQPQPAREPAR